MVGDIGRADGAEKDGVEGLELRHSVLGHHAAVGLIVVRAPVEVMDAELEISAALLEHLQHLQTGGDDLGADPVGRNGGNLVFAHCRRFR